MHNPDISAQGNGKHNASVASDSINKTKIIFEVTAVFAAALGAMWLMEWIPGFEVWQRKTFRAPIISVLLSTVLFPFFALMIYPNSKQEALVMNAQKVKEAVKIGGKSFSVMMPVTFLSFPIVSALGYPFYSWAGGLIIAGWHLLAIPVLCLLFKKYDIVRETGFSATDLVRILGILIITAISIYGLKFLHPKLSGILISLVYIGFAEEFMFRGYIQGRLNQAFGKPFRMMSFSFGWGLIIAALLFGSMHVLSPGNPLHLAWGLWTFIAGMCFGIIREKGGSFLASALVHGIIMIFPVFFG